MAANARAFRQGDDTDACIVCGLVSAATMTLDEHFPCMGFLGLFARSDENAMRQAGHDAPQLTAQVPLASGNPLQWTAAALALLPLLQAWRATWQAASDTALAADELRRYQKYAKPGRPSAHIVQLRQKQAAARQASNIARQALIKAAAAFVREAGIDVPERRPLDAFIVEWLGARVPRDAGNASDPR